MVLDVQSVEIEYDAETAQLVGAGVGGLIANQATSDSHEAVRTAATAAGAGVGAVAGDMVASGALSPAGEQLILELESGEVIAISQEPGEKPLKKGDLVWVVRGSERTQVFVRSN